jgi:toxic protein SymE
MKKERHLSVYGFKGRRGNYPAEIRIKGQWLKDFGFDVGVHYHVECEDGKLILTTLSEEKA